MSDLYTQGFSVRSPMWTQDGSLEGDWHGGSTMLDDYPGRDKAMELAGHDFDIIEVPVFGKQERDVEGLVTVSYPEIAGWKRLVSSKDGHTIHVAKDSYTVVQNSECWDIIDALAEQENVKYETAGLLKDGAIAWALAYIDEPQTVEGDNSPVFPFICVTWSHDGSGAVQARPTTIRVVCWNTLSASETEAVKHGRNFTFRHTKNVKDKIEEAKEVIRGAREGTDAFIEISNELVKVHLGDEGVEKFITTFIREPEADVVSDVVRRHIEEERDKVRFILNSPTIPYELKDTAYAMVQAGGEYLDHLRKYQNTGTYLGRTLLRDEAAKTKLIPLVRKIAQEVAA